MVQDLKIIVVTGGPCGGKTSALEHLRDELARRGWSLVLVPECATALIAAGIAPWTSTVLDFQTAVFELQLAEEAVFFSAARRVPGNKTIVVCDRGLMDGKGYLTDGQFADLMASHGVTEEDAYGRYDAVFHLESAAKGLQEAYTLENNSTRFEDPDEAVRVDNRILESWAGHPYRRVIQNEERFEQKVEHLIDEVLVLLA